MASFGEQDQVGIPPGRGRGSSTRVRRMCGKRVDCLKEKTRLQKKAVKALNPPTMSFHITGRKQKVLGHHESLLSGDSS